MKPMLKSAIIPAVIIATIVIMFATNIAHVVELNHAQVTIESISRVDDNHTSAHVKLIDGSFTNESVAHIYNKDVSQVTEGETISYREFSQKFGVEWNPENNWQYVN